MIDQNHLHSRDLLRSVLAFYDLCHLVYILIPFCWINCLEIEIIVLTREFVWNFCLRSSKERRNIVHTFRRSIFQSFKALRELHVFRIIRFRNKVL